MSNFIEFRDKINKRLEFMSQYELFKVDVEKKEMWDTYLGSFPYGSNPIHKERTQHDCQCCKQFISSVGNIVALVDGFVLSVWDIEIEDEDYQVVSSSMLALIKSKPVLDVFRTKFKQAGVKQSRILDPVTSDLTTWSHFHHTLDNKFVTQNAVSEIGVYRTNKALFERGMKEITLTSLEVIVDLIQQNSLYRGEEHLASVSGFKSLKAKYNELQAYEADFFYWVNSESQFSRFKNTVIGTLACDISDGVDLDKAVSSFESKVAPLNYKRPKALVTENMIKQAQKEIETLGLLNSLGRRYANIDDITVNNIVFANRDSKESMNIFDDMINDVSVNANKLGKVESVSIDKFLSNILPNAKSVEVLIENNHINNMVSLIAPTDCESKNMLKWDNNFTWSYKGEAADSIKERVAKAGGNVTGDLRCSLSWYNTDDLDIHLIEPDGYEIYYSRMTSLSGGRLDVDMNAGGAAFTRKGVENITYKNKDTMQEGRYQLMVKNYTQRETVDVGFEIEVEFCGEVYNFTREKAVPNGQKVSVINFNYSRKDGIVFDKDISQGKIQKDVWGVKTNSWHNVSVVMNSPNHWDDNESGNRHLFFMLDKCANPEISRGFYNEFLSNDLMEHRKVFEVLGSKMKVEYKDKQLSGIGFSSTVRSSVKCRVKGAIDRIVEVQF